MLPTHEEIQNLTMQERLELISSIWQSLPLENLKYPVSADVKNLLDTRLEESKNTPLQDWDEFRSRLEKKFKK